MPKEKKSEVGDVEALLFDLEPEVEAAMHDAHDDDRLSTGLSRVVTAIAALRFTREQIDRQAGIAQKAGADEAAERGGVETVTPRDPWEHIGDGKK